MPKAQSVLDDSEDELQAAIEKGRGLVDTISDAWPLLERNIEKDSETIRALEADVVKAREAQRARLAAAKEADYKRVTTAADDNQKVSAKLDLLLERLARVKDRLDK